MCIGNFICNILLIVRPKLLPVPKICPSERSEVWRSSAEGRGLDGSAGLCFQPAGLQDRGANTCLIELMVLREVVFVLCVYSNKMHPPLAFTVTAKSGN